MSTDMDRRIPRSRWRSRRILIGGALVVGLGVVAYLGASFFGATQRSVRVPATSVTIDTVQRGVFHDLTPLRGKVVPHDIIFLDAEEGGQVQRVMARGGDMVTAGQPLLAFRNTELELDVLDREGRLVESITQLQSYEKQLEDSRLANEKAAVQIDYILVRLGRAADRRRELSADGYIPVETSDQLRDELAYNVRLRPLQARTNAGEEALRLRQLPAIRAELVSLHKSLAITHGKLDNLVVKAPVSGQLASLIQNVGENHNRGDRLGEIVPNTGFKVTATVDEFYLGRVRVGQSADVDIDGRTWKLRAERVYPQVKDGVFTVDLAFEGPTPSGLRPGQAVEGKLSLGGDRPAVILPAGGFLERSGGDWVMVADAGGRFAERRRVKIGGRNAEQVEILSGLKPGDRVITSDYTGFEKVDRVNLAK
jgi:HlyD family secretion protein